jgi:imidazolonepropionase-like amidohydrolase
MKKICVLISLVSMLSCGKPPNTDTYSRIIIRELNETEIKQGDQLIALVGATLIDGNGGKPTQNSCVIVRHGKIESVGKVDSLRIPAAAKVVDVNGMYMLPGLIDAHYHNEESLDLAPQFLNNGITSVRDPGAWIEAYDALRNSHRDIPRLFLTGPHLDTSPPAYPKDAYIVRDQAEGSLAVEEHVAKGATAIKVYFRLPVATIREVCATAHRHGIPVTAHLEIVNARDAIDAGVDGIEHITSLGTCLIPPREAEKYKQKVLQDNNARRRGRYEMWNSISLSDNRKADSLVAFLSLKNTFVSPTLAVFERQSVTGDSDSVEVNGFRNMLKFAGQLVRGNVPLVVGSHSLVPFAEEGYAYFREMELLHEAGMEPMEVIIAATMNNARFFRIDERLGSIEAGKNADIILLAEDPLKDIKAMRSVKAVMLNGVWVRELE